MAHRVLLTRSRPEELAALLAARGVDVVAQAALLSVSVSEPPPEHPPAVVVLTSSRAARDPRVVAHLAGLPLLSLPRTARLLEEQGLNVVAVASGGQEAVQLAQRLVGSEQRLWFVGARRPAAPTTRALSAWQGPVDRWVVYETHPTDRLEALRQAVVEADLVELSSPRAASVVRGLTSDRKAVVAIGPTTAQAARKEGLDVVKVSPNPAPSACAQTILEALETISPETASG